MIKASKLMQNKEACAQQGSDLGGGGSIALGVGKKIPIWLHLFRLSLYPRTHSSAGIGGIMYVKAWEKPLGQWECAHSLL